MKKRHAVGLVSALAAAELIAGCSTSTPGSGPETSAPVEVVDQMTETVADIGAVTLFFLNNGTAKFEVREDGSNELKLSRLLECMDDGDLFLHRPAGDGVGLSNAILIENTPLCATDDLIPDSKEALFEVVMAEYPALSEGVPY